MATTTCPIFSPSLEEFSCFQSYIRKVREQVGNVGICKIIPPSGWWKRKANKYSLENLSHLTVVSPIQQVASGRAGAFDVDLIGQNSIPISEFVAFAEKNGFKENDFEIREKKFWKTLGKSCEWPNPIYGADVPGSLFEKDRASGWNVNQLDSILNLLGDEGIPGVNRSYLYFGSWRAFFAYHVEDCDLYSINFLHTGAPKSWYSIPLSQKQRFEIMAESHFPAETIVCKEFLRHKTKMFSPTKLKENNIPFSTVLQQEGEIVITFPSSYHAGFNHGFNIAESTNFATPEWFEIGKKTKSCMCVPDSVRIDVLYLETLYLRKLLQDEKNKVRSKYDEKTLNCDNDIETSLSFEKHYRVRCVCGTDVNLSDEEKDEILQAQANGDSLQVYMCSFCGLSSHNVCLSNDDNDDGGSMINDDMLCCYLCKEINQNEKMKLKQIKKKSIVLKPLKRKDDVKKEESQKIEKFSKSLVPYLGLLLMDEKGKNKRLKVDIEKENNSFSIKPVLNMSCASIFDPPQSSLSFFLDVQRNKR